MGEGHQKLAPAQMEIHMDNVTMIAKATHLKTIYSRDRKGSVIATHYRVSMEAEDGRKFAARIDDTEQLYKVGVNTSARYTIDESHKEFAHLGAMASIVSIARI